MNVRANVAAADFGGQLSRAISFEFAVPFLRKNIRLCPESYVGTGCSFVTICCAKRQRLFARPGWCKWFLNLLRQEATLYLFAVHAYCLMPDHVHLLLEGLAPESDLLRFVKALKTKSAAAWQQRTGITLWQKKFYDHILRQKDSPNDVSWYIWMNPVRAGICSRPEDYPFLGSFTGVAPKTLVRFSEWLAPWRKTRMPPKVRGRYMSPD